MPRDSTVKELEHKIEELEYENQQNRQNLEDCFAEIEARDEKITNLKMQLKVAESRRCDSFTKELAKIRTKNRKLMDLLKAKEEEMEMYKAMVQDKPIETDDKPIEMVDLTTKEETTNPNH